MSLAIAKSPRTGKTKVSRTLDLAGLSRRGRPPSAQVTTDHPQATPDPPHPITERSQRTHSRESRMPAQPKCVVSPKTSLADFVSQAVGLPPAEVREKPGTNCGTNPTPPVLQDADASLGPCSPAAWARRMNRPIRVALASGTMTYSRSRWVMFLSAQSTTFRSHPRRSTEGNVRGVVPVLSWRSL